MNVAHDFGQISVLLAEIGFRAILKKTSAPFVADIEINGMIGNQRPGKAGCLRCGQKFFQTRQKVFPVAVIPEYLFAPHPPDHNMMQGTWYV